MTRWVDLCDVLALEFLFDFKTHLQALHGSLDFSIHHTFGQSSYWIKILGNHVYKFRFGDGLRQRKRQLVLTPTPRTLFTRQIDLFLRFERVDGGQNRLTGSLHIHGQCPEYVRVLKLTEDTEF